MSHHDRSVLITGGTSGIGRACAFEFAALGFNVAISGRDERRGTNVVDAMVQGGAGKTLFIKGDLCDAAFVQQLVKVCVSAFGGLDVLVNNAGVLLPGNAMETKDEIWATTMSVNVRAPFILSRAAVEQMRKQGGGQIVNIASEWGLNGQPGFLAYCSSKGALVQMTRAMALDHAAEHIRINAVCPGEVRTAMVEEIAEKNHANLDDDAAGIPMRRIASPEEISGVVAYLVSARAAYITGAMISVDGGVGAVGGAYP